MSEVKILLLHKRSPELTVESWDAFWRGEHTSRLAALHGVVRLIQDVPRRGTITPPLDGIDEAFFLDEWAGRSTLGSRAVAALVSELRGHEADGFPLGFLAYERIAVPRTDGSSAVRRMAAVRKQPRLDDATFEREWRDVHPRLVAPLPGLLGYLQSVRLAGVPGLDAPSGGSTLWWESVDVCEAAYAERNPVNLAHNADMTRLFSGGIPTGTYCDPVEVRLTAA